MGVAPIAGRTFCDWADPRGSADSSSHTVSFKVSLPQVIAWVALAVGIVVTERLLAHQRTGVADQAASASDQLMQAAFAASLMTGIVGSLLVHWGSLPSSVSLLAGVLVGGTGLVVRGSAMHSLGRFYTLTPGIEADQRVITSGLYRWVRHPGYVGILLQLLGLEILIGTPIALSASLLVVVAFPVRIAVEERLLLDHFGAEYRAYRDHTRYRLVPGVF